MKEIEYCIHYDTCKRCPKNKECEKEYIFLALRLAKGLDFSDYKEKFGGDFYAKYTDICQKFLSAGLMQMNESAIFLTQKGFLLANYILSEFI